MIIACDPPLDISVSEIDGRITIDNWKTKAVSIINKAMKGCFIMCDMCYEPTTNQNWRKNYYRIIDIAAHKGRPQRKLISTDSLLRDFFRRLRLGHKRVCLRIIRRKFCGRGKYFNTDGCINKWWESIYKCYELIFYQSRERLIDPPSRNDFTFSRSIDVRAWGRSRGATRHPQMKTLDSF